MTSAMTKAETSSTDSLAQLEAAVGAFVDARDWSQFHTPKNLSMALAGECGEVLEHFQWLTPESSAALDTQTRTEVGHELADVFLYTLMLARSLNIDLLGAAREKMTINAARYPAAKARGSARRAAAYATPDSPGETPGDSLDPDTQT